MRRWPTIAEGGVSVNNAWIDNGEWVPQRSDFLHGRWLVLRRGKRNIAGVERVRHLAGVETSGKRNIAGVERVEVGVEQTSSR